MNTAPQDDFSGDLARDLGGWSDDALLKELSRRTTITTDADHELISTGAGLHLQHRQITEPDVLTVTYDPDAGLYGQWTIKVDGLRWTSQQNPHHHLDVESGSNYSPTQGVFETVSWKFDDEFDDDTPAALIVIGIYREPDASDHSYRRYKNDHTLRFAVVYEGSTPAFDIIETVTAFLYPAVERNGTLQQVALVRLAKDGAYTIPSGIATPHVTATPHIPAIRSRLEFVSSVLYVYDLARGDADSPDYDDTPPSELQLTIPNSTDDIVQFGRIVGETNPQLKLRSGSVKWAEPYPLQICHIQTDSAGNLLALDPLTGRQHYRPSTHRTAFGTIASKTSANVYSVNIYEDGFVDADLATTRSSTETVNCYIPQIHADEIIPAGSVVSLIYVGDHWEFQVPIWL